VVRWLRGRYAPCNMYMSARCVKVGLRFSPDLFRCDSCGLQFLQSGNNYYDLLPHHLLENKGNQWRERQQEMEERNKDLIASPLPRIIAWIRLHPLCPPPGRTIRRCPGRWRGAAGIVRDYLPRNTT
jgi:hypothetical protein